MRRALALLSLLPLTLTAPLAAQDSAATDQLPFFLLSANRPTDSVLAYSGDLYRPLRPGEVRAASYLSEDAELLAGEALGPTAPATVRVPDQSAVVALGSAFAVRPPAGSSYQVGDTLTIVRLEPGPRGWGRIVVPTGLVVVESVGPRQTVTRLSAIYGAIRPGQAVLPTAAVRQVGAVDPLPSGPSLGSVIAPHVVRDLVMPGSELYVALGAASGVKVGDFVAIHRRPGPRLNAADATADLLARGQVLHVGTAASTVRLIEVISPVIPDASPVRVIARLPD